LRIIRFTAENIKRLKTVDITPNKFMVRLSGGNGAGKSSVLDSIEYALMGTKTVPNFPVRKGSGKAFIKVDLGEIVVTRRITEGSPKRAGYLTIEGKDGKVWKDPDEVLRSLMGAISFDPLDFIQMPAKAQFDALSHIAMPDVDLDAIEVQAKADYDARTVAKKERDALYTRRDAIHVPADLPKEKYDEAALITELQQAGEFNAGIEREKRERENLHRERAQIERATDERIARIDELKKEIERLEVETRKDAGRVAQTDAIIDAWPELDSPKDSAEIAERINNARTINAAIDRAATRAKIDAEAEAKQEEWKKLDEAVERGQRQKDEALALAKYPIEGLGFDTGKREVIYNGLPFDQSSHAEQMKTSVAIGMAINPKLRIMRIKDGSLLDDKSLDIVSEMAHEHDFQVWIETVSTTGKVGIYLEDGEVVTVNDEPRDTPAKAKKKTGKKILAKA
jgi:hypothetical protein